MTAVLYQNTASVFGVGSVLTQTRCWVTPGPFLSDFLDNGSITNAPCYIRPPGHLLVSAPAITNTPAPQPSTKGSYLGAAQIPRLKHPSGVKVPTGSTYVIKKEREEGGTAPHELPQPLPSPVLLLHPPHPPVEGAAKAAQEWFYFFPFFPHLLTKVKMGRGCSLPDFSG